jgi:hypothetical protein
MTNRMFGGAIVSVCCLLFMPVRCHALWPHDVLRPQWMKWNQTQRTTFVDGWIWGALYGKRAGCGSGLDLLEGNGKALPSDAGNQCLGEFPKSLTTEIMVKQVTAYYLRYPNPKHVGPEVSDILEGLVEGRTFEQIR